MLMSPTRSTRWGTPGNVEVAPATETSIVDNETRPRRRVLLTSTRKRQSTEYNVADLQTLADGDIGGDIRRRCNRMSRSPDIMDGALASSRCSLAYRGRRKL